MRWSGRKCCCAGGIRSTAVLSPGAFIDALAESPIAPDVGRWIIRTACERLSAWRAMGLPLARVGVNLFPAQVYDEMLPKDIAGALRDFGLPADALELEITENVALNREDSSVLQSLHDQGVKLAFDDFGTGYASLSHLSRFPVSRIKIDRSFVGKITQDARDAAIVRSLIVMAHNLELGVIAASCASWVILPTKLRSILMRRNREAAQVAQRSVAGADRRGQATPWSCSGGSETHKMPRSCAR